jgi:hypothetical protein
MKIRYRLAAIVSAVALTGPALLASAGTASAVTEHYICLNSSALCITSNGSGNPVGTSPGTNFATEYPETTNGHEYVEFYQVGTNACLADSGAKVYLETCTSGDSRELWWNDANVPELQNLYATLHYGYPECMSDGYPDIIVEGCGTAGSGAYWYWG